MQVSIIVEQIWPGSIICTINEKKKKKKKILKILKKKKILKNPKKMANMSNANQNNIFSELTLCF